ncbi:hypothetical protein P9726_00655 [Geobacillus stearothermophilus]|uniref:hypothetical protein n=1 Tax=Geobacillus stearothermophilus TaxID=1422 RepID=UPI002E22E9F5|nr:hypothetical protein [Geobacillus stearothermophilus]MED4978263.1 hypothetical protein [Geobacillus stearothermophilus]
MAMLRKVCLSSEYRRELQKRFVIRRLLEIGIDEYNGRDIHELNYDELKRILALTRATRS